MENKEVYLGNIMGPQGPAVPIDDEISDTSENAVKSRVVKEYIDNILGDINEVLSTILEGYDNGYENIEEE